MLVIPVDVGAGRQQRRIGLPTYPDGDLPVDEQENNSRQQRRGPEPISGTTFRCEQNWSVKLVAL